MIGRTSKLVAFAFAVALVPSFLSAQTAADAVKNSATSALGAAKEAAANASGLQSVLAGGDFKTLSEALNKADLLPMLTDGKAYTIFAPTDAAFKKLPEAELKELLSNPAELKKVLQNHVVVGKVSAADATAMAGKNAKTAANTEVPVTVVDGKVKFGGATVTKADVPAGPSVVHVIDTVVLPAPATAAKEEKKAMMEKKTDHHMADEKKADMKGEKADKKEAK
ncbi:MAG TPA: fasciclin domain-containing protein [Candidatus Sumerlaeota bacterium]|nr:fasciclin domain-containing protein [Candidatus Sumerlaeota bacterium]HMZ51266.1 fasciclin domain-containing protein [Candidatus Sumerlaeota bacterium]HNM45698.1 fasciclin domain-containing protein [Candidatus Sumerlaeota bacterium]